MDRSLPAFVSLTYPRVAALYFAFRSSKPPPPECAVPAVHYGNACGGTQPLCFGERRRIKRSRLIAPGERKRVAAPETPRLAGSEAPARISPRIGVINDRGVINCGLH